MPGDLDINLHMNNGRYLTICDLTRVDMFIRSRLARTMLKEQWISVIAEHTMTYMKLLKPFQKYLVTMAVTGWDDSSFDMVHIFLVGGRIMADGTSRGIIVRKGRRNSSRAGVRNSCRICMKI